MDGQCNRRKKISKLSSKLLLQGLFLLLSLSLNLNAQQATKSIIDAYEKDIKKGTETLDSIKIELDRGRKKIEELANKEGDFLTQLNQLEKNMSDSKEYVALLSNRIDTINSHVLELKDSIVIYSNALKLRQNKMASRLKTIYTMGNPTLLEIFFTSINLGDVLSKIRYFQALSDYDKSLLNSIDSTNKLVKSKKTIYEKEIDELSLRRDEKRSEQVLLARQKESRSAMLLKVRNEKDAYLDMVNELKSAQKEFNFLVSRLEKKKRDAKLEFEQNKKIAFAKRKGKLPWPVTGSVIKKYGKVIHPVYKTVTMNNGIDIAANKGDAVFSVAPGEVDYIGTMRGYGKFVIINHFGGYMTIYAHLNTINIQQGKQVKYGSLLGTVGETGSLDGVKLHFQIRKSTKTVDPEKWLVKKANG